MFDSHPANLFSLSSHGIIIKFSIFCVRCGWEKALWHTRPYFVELSRFWLTLTHPQHPTTFLSNFFYFPCRNVLVRKLSGNCRIVPTVLCMHMLDSGLSLSRTSNTGNFRYHKYQVSQEPVMQTLAICISMESY